MVMISGASSPLYAKRRRRNVITMGLSFAATAFGLSWLVLILAVLFRSSPRKRGPRLCGVYFGTIITRTVI